MCLFGKKSGEIIRENTLNPSHRVWALDETGVSL
jgi:hypothetical protein